MSKRYFKIDLGRYGGELTIGTVTQEFVEYWAEREEDELREHLQGVEFDDQDMMDNDSPNLKDAEDYPNPAYFEIDDILHISSAYADNEYTVSEITLKDGVTLKDGELINNEGLYGNDCYDEDYDSEVRSDYLWSVSRECYSSGLDIDFEDDDAEYTPVLQYHSAEKGVFGEVYIETDGEDFDPNKLVISYVETDICEMIERVFYDNKEVNINYDQVGTDGKGMNFEVAYIRKDYIDSEDIQDQLDEVYEDINWSLKEE